MATLEERLAEYEVLFADRYTEKDEGYQKHIAAPVKLPPVVTDWNTGNYDRLVCILRMTCIAYIYH